MEKSAKRKGNPGAAVILVPVITGLAVFTVCVLLFPLFLMKTDDPVSYIPVAACSAVALTAFSAALSLSKMTKLHFAAAAFLTALTLSALLIVAGLIFGNTNETGFTAVNCIMSLVFAMLGGKLGKAGAGKKRKRR